MWIALTLCSALFAGITSILAKVGIKEINSTLATAMRTIVVFIFAWIMVFIVGSQTTITTISQTTWLFLILSGLATGASWLCYYKALQLGEINKVVPIDKSSTVLTMLLAFLILGEELTLLKIIAIAFISIGTFMMIQKQKQTGSKIETKSWIIYAILSAVFASLTTILGKIGINGVEASLGTAIRTSVVLLMSWIMVFVGQDKIEFRVQLKKDYLFIFLSGLATGASWLCYYHALQDGLTTAVVAIDKLSIVVTIIFSYFVFKEKLTLKSFLGLISIIIGTLYLLF